MNFVNLIEIHLHEAAKCGKLLALIYCNELLRKLYFPTSNSKVFHVIINNNLECLKYLSDGEKGDFYGRSRASNWGGNNACTRWIKIFDKLSGSSHTFSGTNPDISTVLSDKFDIHGGVIFDISKRSW
jgi:hypothetical protein